MTQQDKAPPKNDSLGGISETTPLRWRHLPRLVAFMLAVTGLLWLLLKVHKKLPSILPSIGNLRPDRAGDIISVFASVLVILAAWTATWAVFPPYDQPLRIRLRNLLEWNAIICVIAIIVLAAETIASDTLRDYPVIVILAIYVLGLNLARFHSTNRQRD